MPSKADWQRQLAEGRAKGRAYRRQRALRAAVRQDEPTPSPTTELDKVLDRLHGRPVLEGEALEQVNRENAKHRVAEAERVRLEELAKLEEQGLA